MSTRASLESLITRHWRKRGWLAWMLWPVSLLFGGLIAGRRWLYASGALEQTNLPVPVIVVGNVYVGGTGKTPLVIWLAIQMKQRGFVPGVISRGHGSHTGQVQEICAGMSPDDAGDEPLLIVQQARVPLFVGRDRVAAARALLCAHPEVNMIIADDGLQHYALGRDIEILLSDDRGMGNGWLLPAGPLREPASRRCDFRVLHAVEATDEHAFTMHLHGQQAEQLIDRSKIMRLSSLPSQVRIAAAAGIGNPQRFFGMLQGCGARLDHTLSLPDHFDYSHNPFANLHADIILITEKDAVKCVRKQTIANDTRLWVVPVQATIAGPLSEHLLEKLRGHSTA